MQLLKNLANNRSTDSLAHKLRRNRFKLFTDFVAKLPKPISILDVGGELSYWQMMGLDEGWQITLLNLTLPDSLPQGFEAVVGDARDMPQFSEQQFDVVFSNSVIEHVGSFADQRRMAQEIQRVGKHYFVQTPNYYFPIEPHFLFPGFQFLPQALKRYLVQNYNLGWYQKISDSVAADNFLSGFRLLSRRELQVLFPKGKIVAECFWGLAKSYIVQG